MFKKSIETEAVFTKIEMTNEWNINFPLNTRFVKKLLRLKLYLPRQLSTMDEPFFFFTKYKFDWKSIKTEALFTKTVMTNEWNINSIQNTRFVKNYLDKLYLPRQ